jgi:UMF1 family MFS transporter
LLAATRRERLAWCVFDFANSAYNTVVLTFVYATFFAGKLAPDRDTGDVWWARMLAVSGALVALLGPWFGAIADRTAHRKGFLVALSLLTIACAASLWFPSVPPGQAHAPADTLLLALVLVGLGNVAFELMFVFYNAFLPGLGDASTIGRLSGQGWACGYAGGLLCLVACLPLTDSEAGVRGTSLVVALWFLLFGWPMWLWVRDRAPRRTTVGLRASLMALRGKPDLVRLLLAHLFYNDALMSIITMAGLYMAGTLGMTTAEILQTGIGLNVVAGLGAFAFGFVDERSGGKRAIVLSLLLLLGGTLIAIAVPTVPAFLLAAALIGLGMGPNQAASRSLLGRFIEPARSAELYGLLALSGKATVWLGPLSFSLVRDATGSQRLGFVPLIGLFVLGLLITLTIDERRGLQSAQRRE